MINEFGVDEEYEAFVADVHPKYKKTGCSNGEALYAQRHPLCSEILPGIPADHCRITNDLCKLESRIPLVEGCQVYQDYLDKIEGQEE